MTNLVSRLRDADMGDDHQTQKLLMDAADEIESQAKTIESLRRDIADPAPDIQEAVLRKLNLWPPPAPFEPRECQCATYCMQALGMRSDPPMRCRGLPGERPPMNREVPR